MRNTKKLILTLMLIGLSASAQSEKPGGDPLDSQLRKLAGPSAIDCTNQKDSKKCALNALQQQQPFILRINERKFDVTQAKGEQTEQNTDSAVGYARNPSGEMHLLIYERRGWSDADLRKCRKGSRLVADRKIIVEQCPTPGTVFFDDGNGSTYFPLTMSSHMLRLGNWSNVNF